MRYQHTTESGCYVMTVSMLLILPNAGCQRDGQYMYRCDGAVQMPYMCEEKRILNIYLNPRVDQLS